MIKIVKHEREKTVTSSCVQADDLLMKNIIFCHFIFISYISLQKNIYKLY